MGDSRTSLSHGFGAAQRLDGGWVTSAGALLPPVPILFRGSLINQDSCADDAARCIRARRNQHCLEKAVLILSQSDTGRHLLQDARHAGFKIFFDQPGNAKHKAEGLCHGAARNITLSDHDDPLKLALLLAHECSHALQHISAPHLAASDRHHLPGAIKHILATEADAFAHAVQTAYELAHPPAGRVGTDRLIACLHLSYPHLAAHVATGFHRDDLATGRLMARAFDGFFADPSLRHVYQDIALELFRTHAEAIEAKGGSCESLFVSEMSGKDIVAHLRWGRLPYVQRHLPLLDLDDPAYSGVSLKTAYGIEGFYQRYLPGRILPPLRILETVPATGSTSPAKRAAAKI